jgi:hypothetical protein
MAFTPELFKRRARRAYEVGRLRLSVPWAVLAGTLGLLGTALTGGGGFGLAMSMLAAAGAVVCVWYGRHVGRGVWPGVWVGSLAMLMALFAWTCAGRGATGFLECRLPCVVAGVIIAAGAAFHVGRTAAARDALLTLLGTASIAIPLALIACRAVGIGGMVGLAVGLALGSAPAMWRVLRASA